MHFVFKIQRGLYFKSSVLAHVHFDSIEAAYLTSELLSNIQHKASLISPTTIVNLTRRTVLCKYSVAEENISNGLNVDR